MSDSGIYSADIRRLRDLGQLIDSVLVGASVSPDEHFRAACDELRSALNAATAKPIETLQSLYLAEILETHVPPSVDRWRAVLNDLSHYTVGTSASELLDALAKSVELERVRATHRMQLLP